MYLPFDFGRNANLGYAFVNLVHPDARLLYCLRATAQVSFVGSTDKDSEARNREPSPRDPRILQAKVSRKKHSTKADVAAFRRVFQGYSKWSLPTSKASVLRNVFLSLCSSKRKSTQYKPSRSSWLLAPSFRHAYIETYRNRYSTGAHRSLTTPRFKRCDPHECLLKVCQVSWSGPHQGFDAHVARYRNSPVMHRCWAEFKGH